MKVKNIWNILLNTPDISKSKFLKTLCVITLAFCLGFFWMNSCNGAGTCRCATKTTGIFGGYSPLGSNFQSNSNDECISSCKGKGATYYMYYEPGYSGSWTSVNASGSSQPPLANILNQAANYTKDISLGKTLVSAAAAPLLWVFNFLLFAVWTVCNLLLFVAAMIFDWAVNPANFTLVVGNEAVYNGWVIVRDFLNLAFILVLLFSAFCTIFQVEKYHLKKILLTLVIMALLVNFSFPVARFIIDTSNVLMYFIIGKAFPSLSETSGLSALVVSTWNIIKLTAPDFKASDIIYAQDFTVKALFAIIFTFLLAITLLVVAVLLVIRIVVLAILIIFSSIGFVAAIFPSTKNFADSWWTQLFKQSFFGPVMLFMVYLALTMMEAMNKDKQLWNSVEKQVTQENALSNYSTIIITGTYLAIPIVILWTGLIAAQKLGAAGAGTVMHGGRRIGNWIRKQPWTRRQAGRVIRRAGDTANRIFRNVPGYGRVSQATFGRIGDTGARMEAQAEIERIKRGRTREDTRHAVVKEHMESMKDINTGGELLSLHQQEVARGRRADPRRLEAILRKAASLGEVGTLLNGTGYNNDAAGFIGHMQHHYGDNAESARLAGTIASLESKNHNFQYGGTSYFNGTDYVFTNPATVVGRQRINDAFFNYAAGEHPQNMFRGLKSGGVATRGAGNAVVGFNESFVDTLGRLGNDVAFHNIINHAGGPNSQLNQIPDSVIQEMTAALAAGAIPTGRMAQLVNELHLAGKL